MSAYIICHYNILDRSRIDELGPLSLPIVEKFGGEICIASPVTVLEQSPYSHMVVYRFPDPDSARAYYESEENQQFAKLRREITDGIVVFAPGFESTAVP